MNKEEYEHLSSLPDRELFDFATEKDLSPRKWAAMYLLDLRKLALYHRTAIASAFTAGLAALAAIASAVVALLQFLNHVPK